MKTAQFLLLCILGAALLSAVNCNNANGPDNCCFKFYPGRIQANLIKSYQLTDHRCPKSYDHCNCRVSGQLKIVILHMMLRT
uniref:Chemokine interleukin-8-like domain-containing protein n=1 Tax=Haplochromis burtoni TaxID=8153 RepID=A0A3Q2VBZ3_HAPBU